MPLWVSWTIMQWVRHYQDGTAAMIEGTAPICICIGHLWRLDLMLHWKRHALWWLWRDLRTMCRTTCFESHAPNFVKSCLKDWICPSFVLSFLQQLYSKWHFALGYVSCHNIDVTCRTLIPTGAAQPEYTITADDCDSMVAIECVPMDERGRRVRRCCD